LDVCKLPRLLPRNLRHLHFRATESVDLRSLVGLKCVHITMCKKSPVIHLPPLVKLRLFNVCAKIHMDTSRLETLKVEGLHHPLLTSTLRTLHLKLFTHTRFELDLSQFPRLTNLNTNCPVRHLPESLVSLHVGHLTQDLSGTRLRKLGYESTEVTRFPTTLRELKLANVEELPDVPFVEKLTLRRYKGVIDLPRLRKLTLLSHVDQFPSVDTLVLEYLGDVDLSGVQVRKLVTCFTRTGGVCTEIPGVWTCKSKC
jgi:hypothetical protein